jgi:DNA repair exonuclease SbcCD ATPase subunit
VKIVRLEANNLLRLKAIDITLSPDGGAVVISGRNAQGKSSLLNAITYALVGPAAMKGIERPIRDGEDEASVEVDIEKYVVRRTWKADGKTSLTVMSKDGAKYSSPQTLLDDLLGTLSFDPLAFANQDAKSQLATLLSLVELPFDPAKLDGKRKAIFDERTEIGRDARQLAAQLAAMPEPPETLPSDEVSAADVLAEQAAHQSAVTAWERAESAVIDEKRDLAAVLERMNQLEDELVSLRLSLGQHEIDVEAAEKRAAALSPKAEEVVDFGARLASIEETNRQVRAAHERATIAASLAGRSTLLEELTTSLTEVDAIKAEALAAADMPIAGLSFDENGVTYQGVPLKQASSAEQLRVSTAIAMAMSPDARIILVKDGSLLDDENLALLDEMAKDEDYQMLIERVGAVPGEMVGFVLEDGEVVA